MWENIAKNKEIQEVLRKAFESHMKNIKKYVIDCDLDEKNSSVEFECSSAKNGKLACDAILKMVNPELVKKVKKGATYKDFEIYMTSREDAVRLAAMIDDIIEGNTGLETNANSKVSSNSELGNIKGSIQAATSLKSALGRSTVSHNENRMDWNNILNLAITTTGSVLTGIFGGRNNSSQTTPAPAAAPAATTYKGKDNTMLYVGIGAGVLVLLAVVLFMVKKKK